MKQLTEKWPKDWIVRLIQLLAVPGMLLAFFLLLYHNGRLVDVCTASGWSDCGKVSGPEAQFSAIGSVPVALIGLIGYIVLFLAAWLKDWVAIVDENLPELLLGLTAVAFLFTLGLTGLEIFVIHAVCPYCLISAVIVTIMFVLSIGYMRQVSKE
ncbi:MAG: vitamin K epoxide reductase family protein [Candidatus Promineifilaceae bacterium]